MEDDTENNGTITIDLSDYDTNSDIWYSAGSGLVSGVTIDTSSISHDSYVTESTFNELSDRITEIEKRLTILKPDDKLKDKYEILQKMYDDYKAMESLLYDGEDE